MTFTEAVLFLLGEDKKSDVIGYIQDLVKAYKAGNRARVGDRLGMLQHMIRKGNPLQQIAAAGLEASQTGNDQGVKDAVTKLMQQAQKHAGVQFGD